MISSARTLRHMSITHQYAYASLSRPLDGECVWYRSNDEAYDLIRTGSNGKFQYHVFDARNGQHLQALSSWQDGWDWIKAHVEGE
ncbi:hypothetical protein DQ384_33995 [Sphaerisporangium album]|uniref:Uncharacterized protein n=2 Tax=Sphaerisporangium album TaxID=509200 RepID=A0A367EZE1_9ACTN|nr:hypothetical protein DQ384_33995 [Sphaerisporangium album]